MLISIEKILPAPALADLRAALSSADAPWVDGRITAGYQGAAVKFNQQLDDASALASQWRRVVVAALERHPGFISATLPNALYPPMFNRYGEGMTFGPHVDGSIRIDPASGRKLRTDVSATLFLSDPKEYDGGELRIHDQYGAHAVKGAAGDLVVYPATSLHQVAPITRGVRLACVFWVQSLVRDDAQRALLFDMDTAIQRLNQQAADEPARQLLVGCYHNLLRQWADTWGRAAHASTAPQRRPNRSEPGTSRKLAAWTHLPFRFAPSSSTPTARCSTSTASASKPSGSFPALASASACSGATSRSSTRGSAR